MKLVSSPHMKMAKILEGELKGAVIGSFSSSIIDFKRTNLRVVSLLLVHQSSSRILQSITIKFKIRIIPKIRRVI
jgi:hypothetical protein